MNRLRFFLCLWLCYGCPIPSQAQGSQNLYQIGIRLMNCIDEAMFSGCSNALLDDWILFLKKEQIQKGSGIAFFNSLDRDRQDGLRIASARAQKGFGQLNRLLEELYCFSEGDKKTFAIIARNTEETVESLFLRMLEKVKTNKKKRHERQQKITEIITRCADNSFLLKLPERKEQSN